MHLYEVRPREDKRGVNLISDVLPFGRLWYGEPDAITNAIEREVSQPHDPSQWILWLTASHFHARQIVVCVKSPCNKDDPAVL